MIWNLFVVVPPALPQMSGCSNRFCTARTMQDAAGRMFITASRRQIKSLKTDQTCISSSTVRRSASAARLQRVQPVLHTIRTSHYVRVHRPSSLELQVTSKPPGFVNLVLRCEQYHTCPHLKARPFRNLAFSCPAPSQIWMRIQYRS